MAPADCIDFILGHNQSSTSYRVVETGIADQSEIDLTAVSDHLPVYVKIDLSNATGNKPITDEKNNIEIVKDGNNYRITGIEGIANVKLYSITGEIIFDTYIQDGDKLPIYNQKSKIVLLWLRNGNEIYTHKLVL